MTPKKVSPAPAQDANANRGAHRRRPPREVLIHCGVAALSLGLVSLAFHPADIPALAWIAFVPWMAFHEARPRRGTARALMLGYYLHFAAVLAWVSEIHVAGTLGIPLLGLPFVFALAWVFDRAIHRWKLPGLLVYPLGIVAMEVVRDRAMGLTWSSAGYTQWRWLELIQSASVFRVHLASFVVLLANAALARAVLHVAGAERRPSRRSALAGLGAAAIVGALVHAWGAWRLSAEFERGPFVAGIQPNIAQHDKNRGNWRDFWIKHGRIWRERRDPSWDPDLLVFAETTLLPVKLPDRPLEKILLDPYVFRDPIGFDGANRPLPWNVFLPKGRGQLTILGYQKWGPEEEGGRRPEWNIAGVVEDGARLVAESPKEKLVPFGEYVPWPKDWPGYEALGRLIESVGGYFPDMVVGTEQPIVDLETPRGAWRFGMNICFETVFPAEFRDRAARGADFVVNISNDGWYRESAELDLVHVAVRFRAIEIGRSVVRVSNTGISTILDPRGRYLDTVERQGRRKSVEGVVAGQVPIARETTAFVRFGDLPAWAFVAAFGGLAAAGWARGRRREPGTLDPSRTR